MAAAVDDEEVLHVVRLLKLVEHRRLRIIPHARGAELVNGPAFRENLFVLTEGWSIHELGTSRMGNDPKTSVLNQFQQSHDVKNLFVVDGSSHVSASCQNPTWTIMALAWRSCEHLADEFKRGNL